MAHQVTSTEAAQALHSTLENAQLNLLSADKQYEQELEDGESLGRDVGFGENASNAVADLRDPAAAAADVAANISFLRKLKFQYLEHSAKDKYIKSIVSDIDDAPIVTAEDNKNLGLTNALKKSTLKDAKVLLEERYKDIARLAPLVEQDYKKARTSTAHATDLSQKILDARLALTRLRQTYPQPRLTIPMATATLEEQILTMQNIEDQLQDLNKQVNGAKDKLRAAKGEMEQVRVERAEVEKAAAMSIEQLGDNDSRLMPLYDWYTASLAFHQSITSLLAWNSVSENEIRLTYRIPTPSVSSRFSATEITVTLLFLPNTRRIAAARVDGLGPDIDISEIVDYHVQADDVWGLIASTLASTRAAMGRRR